jgi:type IV secretory pathway TraG/TraD family ATPase VirD4
MTFIEIKRKLRIASVVAGFIGLGIGLAITKGGLPLPYLNIANFMPNHIQGISDWLYVDTLKGFIIPNFSAFLTYFFPVWIAILFYQFKFQKHEEEIFKRGSKLLETKALRKTILKSLKRSNDHTRYAIGQEQIPMPFTQEVKNVLYVAMPGAGKTQGIYSNLFGAVAKNGKKISDGIVDFNEPLICYERKGSDFVDTLYRRGKDLLFDPRDRDCIRWNIFKDMLTADGTIDEAMVNFFVTSLLPVSDSKAAHFEEQGQSVIKAVLLAVAGSNNATNKGLIDFLRTHPTPQELRTALIEDPTVQLYGADNGVIGALTLDAQANLDNQATSVYSSCNKAFKNLSQRAFYYEESNFSVREFIASLKDENRDIRLFIVNTAVMAGAYNTYFGLFFMLLYKHILALPNSHTRRITWILDELMSLATGNKALGKHLISELINTLAESRSKGLSAHIAFQSLSQANEIVGDNLLKSLFQMCGTKIILQYSEPYGSKVLSQFLGEKEIERKKHGVNRAGEMSQDRMNETEEEKIKKIVLEAEFSNLEPLEAFIKIGSFPVSKIHFGYQQPEAICDPLIPRELPFFDTPTAKALPERFMA